MSRLADAMVGSLLGQALGDALGFVVEARPHQEARDYARSALGGGDPGAFGQYSDDTQLARELLLSIVEARGWAPDRFAHRIAQLFASGRDVGAGPGTRAAALRIHSGDHWTQAASPAPYAGNGSAMRVIPIGVLHAPDLERVASMAGEQSRVTHQDPRCEAGAIAVAVAAALAVDPEALDPVRCIERIGEIVRPVDASVADAIGLLAGWIALPPEAAVRRLEAARLDPAGAGPWQGISAFVVPSVTWSLYAFLHAPEDYRTAVRTAIEVGGDTDTMAAIAGGLVGARVGPAGLPEPMVQRVHDQGQWGAAELSRLARAAAELVEG